MVRALFNSKVSHKFWMLWRGYSGVSPLESFKMSYIQDGVECTTGK